MLFLDSLSIGPNVFTAMNPATLLCMLHREDLFVPVEYISHPEVNSGAFEVVARIISEEYYEL